MIWIFFGWPAIIIFLIIAAIGVRSRNYVMLLVAMFIALPNCFYLLAANNWVRIAGILIPVLFGIAAYATKNGMEKLTKATLLPVYLFYIYLAYIALNQPPHY